MPKIDKYLIFALICAFFNAAAVFFIFGFLEYGDSSSHIGSIHWFRGENIKVDEWSILRPLGILIALPFEFLGAGAGLIAQNIIFYFLSAFLIFKIVDLIFHNKKQAFLASLFFVTTTQVIETGLAYLTDAGAWFFYLLSIFLTLLYFRNKNNKLIILNGFIAGLGFLMKESGGLGVLFFGLMILFSSAFNFKEKALKIVRFGIFFLIPIIVWQIFMYQRFHITSLDWYLAQLGGFSHGQDLVMVLFRYFGQLFRTLGVLWIFFFIGLRQELKSRDWGRLKIYLAMLPVSLSFFLWPISAGGRSVFIFAPLGIILATYGFRKMGYLPLCLIIAIILVLNYTFSWFNSAIPFIDTIAKFLGIL